MTKNLLSLLPVFIFFSLIFSGCEVIGDIFKAGIWVGIIIVIAVVAVIGFLIKLFKN
jgi:hypothetical protein